MSQFTVTAVTVGSIRFAIWEVCLLVRHWQCEYLRECDKLAKWKEALSLNPRCRNNTQNCLMLMSVSVVTHLCASHDSVVYNPKAANPGAQGGKDSGLFQAVRGLHLCIRSRKISFGAGFSACQFYSVCSVFMCAGFDTFKWPNNLAVPFKQIHESKSSEMRSWKERKIENQYMAGHVDITAVYHK